MKAAGNERKSDLYYYLFLLVKDILMRTYFARHLVKNYHWRSAYIVLHICDVTLVRRLTCAVREAPLKEAGVKTIIRIAAYHESYDKTSKTHY